MEPLNFTLRDLSQAIGRDLMQAHRFKAYAYMFFDLAMVAACSVVILWSLNNEKYWLLAPAIFFQGNMLWSVFVIGHDCGHGSFSKSQKTNNFWGNILHSIILLVPFYSWKKSHLKHHQFTGNIDKDESHVPMRLKHVQKGERLIKKNLAARLGHLIYTWGFYFPLYLIKNVHPNLKGDKYSHFRFNKILFDTENKKGMRDYDRLQFRVSVTLVAISGLLLAIFTVLFPLESLCLYWIPWLIYNWLLFAVTYLHHTDPDIPWYYDEDWEYLRGALSTQDHTMGFLSPIVNFFHHHIESHHVAHHIFTAIPHYNLKKSTERIKPILGKHYRQRPYGLFQLSNVMKSCSYVEDPSPQQKKYFYQRPIQEELVNTMKPSDSAV